MKMGLKYLFLFALFWPLNAYGYSTGQPGASGRFGQSCSDCHGPGHYNAISLKLPEANTRECWAESQDDSGSMTRSLLWNAGFGAEVPIRIVIEEPTGEEAPLCPSRAACCDDAGGCEAGIDCRPGIDDCVGPVVGFNAEVVGGGLWVTGAGSRYRVTEAQPSSGCSSDDDCTGDEICWDFDAQTPSTNGLCGIPNRTEIVHSSPITFSNDEAGWDLSLVFPMEEEIGAATHSLEIWIGINMANGNGLPDLNDVSGSFYGTISMGPVPDLPHRCLVCDDGFEVNNEGACVPSSGNGNPDSPTGPDPSPENGAVVCSCSAGVNGPSLPAFLAIAFLWGWFAVRRRIGPGRSLWGARFLPLLFLFAACPGPGPGPESENGDEEWPASNRAKDRITEIRIQATDANPFDPGAEIITTLSYSSDGLLETFHHADGPYCHQIDYTHEGGRLDSSLTTDCSEVDPIEMRSGLESSVTWDGPRPLRLKRGTGIYEHTFPDGDPQRPHRLEMEDLNIGMVIDYTWDDEGRQTQRKTAHFFDGQEDGAHTEDFIWDDRGRLEKLVLSVQYTNQDTSTYDYSNDEDDRLIRFERGGQYPLIIDVEYDDSGRISALLEEMWTTTYTYESGATQGLTHHPLIDGGDFFDMRGKNHLGMESVWTFYGFGLGY
jgi:hypothetical protein